MKRLTVMIVITSLFLSCSKKENTENQNKAQQTQVQSLSQYKETDYYFKLPLYNGGEVDLKNYAGKPVLVMFFTENCPYCQKAAPFIETMYKKYSSKGLGVVGISVRPNPESAKYFATEFKLTFELAYNGKDVAKRYGISGVPFVYLLNKDHTLNKVWAGYDKSYESNIDETISKII